MQISSFAEKTFIAVLLFAGFTYLRRRAHRVDPERQMSSVLLGIFTVLPIFLVLEAKFLPVLPLEYFPKLALKVSLLALTFWGVGHFVLKPKLEAPSDSQG